MLAVGRNCFLWRRSKEGGREKESEERGREVGREERRGEKVRIYKQGRSEFGRVPSKGWSSDLISEE